MNDVIKEQHRIINKFLVTFSLALAGLWFIELQCGTLGKIFLASSITYFLAFIIREAYLDIKGEPKTVEIEQEINGAEEFQFFKNITTGDKS
ncbi:hypothetical protein BCEN4_740036 [Burkholderia cenocepacia]|uniref:hypothetical protein n=1 Tax=Burkholderia cenocepacia TaxID=95486 RepID=UPI00192AA77C|nr:hypothetical protein [Burkholderia cenocepacia]CAD9227893.1 hypothetical protein BCEN4_740036 [Burkholderia cenocepacia]